MQTLDFHAFIADIEARKAMLGGALPASRLRNGGGVRTPEKRAALERAARRARAAGLKPVPASF
ncbi:hypothetical protein [Sphingomonas lycopersici]|uniref:Uncharacterized protein n=1 Tax=Sphingomonas lycopersici TaxID=2951807 RepID=A0AA42CTB6_9SPHN|nr:hypothetical protein [Sphingomonas lycopersici]MCW6534201.1 hypothetical protein [Sphingomonas lycopersici]